MRAIIFVISLFVTSPVFAADQFDLLCTAQKEKQHYRIDLSKNEWCFGSCDVVRKISSVTTGTIVLAEHLPEFARDSTSYNRVNRQTGAWEWYNRTPGSFHVMDIKGQCEAAPFSGMALAGTSNRF